MSVRLFILAAIALLVWPADGNLSDVAEVRSIPTVTATTTVTDGSVVTVTKTTLKYCASLVSPKPSTTCRRKRQFYPGYYWPHFLHAPEYHFQDQFLPSPVISVEESASPVFFRTDRYNQETLPIESSFQQGEYGSSPYEIRTVNTILALPAAYVHQIASSLIVLASYVKYSGVTHTSYITVTTYTSTTTSTAYSGTATYALSGSCIPSGVTTCR